MGIGKKSRREGRSRMRGNARVLMLIYSKSQVDPFVNVKRAHKTDLTLYTLDIHTPTHTHIYHYLARLRFFRQIEIFNVTQRASQSCKLETNRRTNLILLLFFSLFPLFARSVDFSSMIREINLNAEPFVFP